MMFDRHAIKQRVTDLAVEIERYHVTHHVTHAVVVLTGALHFASDLLRVMEIDLPVSFIAVQSYKGNVRVHNPKILYYPPYEVVHDQHILVIEDIVDTGDTIVAVRRHLFGMGAKSIRTVSLLMRSTCLITVEHVGFVLEGDEFVIGYGLDVGGKGRHTYGIESV